MNRQMFFTHIKEICDWDSLGDDDKVLAPLIKYLAEQSDEDIFVFDDIMAGLLYDLDTRKNFVKARKFYDHSDDSFLYSRCAALTNGEEYYEKVKSGKTKEVWQMEFEAILTVPQLAWELKHKNNDYPHMPALSIETGSNAKEWE